MNPNTNRFERLSTEEMADVAKQVEKLSSAIENMADYPEADNSYPGLIRPDGTPVPKHWAVFHVGEEIVIKGYTFKVAYIGETSILFEPVGPPLIKVPPEE